MTDSTKAVDLNLVGNAYRVNGESKPSQLKLWYFKATLSGIAFSEEAMANSVGFQDTDEGWILICGWRGDLQGVFVPENLLVENAPATEDVKSIIMACRAFEAVQRIDDEGVLDEW